MSLYTNDSDDPLRQYRNIPRASAFGRAVHYVLEYLTNVGDPQYLTPEDVVSILRKQFHNFPRSFYKRKNIEYVTLAWQQIGNYVLQSSTFFSTEVDFLGNRQVDIILEHPDGTIELVEIKTYSGANKKVREALEQLGNARRFILRNYPETRLKWTVITIKSDPTKPFTATFRHFPT